MPREQEPQTDRDISRRDIITTAAVTTLGILGTAVLLGEGPSAIKRFKHNNTVDTAKEELSTLSFEDIYDITIVSAIADSEYPIRKSLTKTSKEPAVAMRINIEKGSKYDNPMMRDTKSIDHVRISWGDLEILAINSDEESEENLVFTVNGSTEDSSPILKSEGQKESSFVLCLPEETIDGVKILDLRPMLKNIFVQDFTLPGDGKGGPIHYDEYAITDWKNSLVGDSIGQLQVTVQNGIPVEARLMDANN
jgi:hypothetical protein